MAKTKDKDAPDFEKSLAELEQLVETMESGDLPLDEALRHFERGIALTRLCQAALKQAELKVEQLLEKNGRAELVPLDPDQADDD
ncbi:MAG: exodeoxyribonuclease VII small subunit [Xanthomonadaceae bacterium]|nr:exodeoxyribonuclease VII small subunit [Xanthomonadaceae bacterium]